MVHHVFRIKFYINKNKLINFVRFNLLNWGRKELNGCLIKNGQLLQDARWMYFSLRRVYSSAVALEWLAAAALALSSGPSLNNGAWPCQVV